MRAVSRPSPSRTRSKARPATERTEVRMLFGKANVYVGIIALRQRSVEDHRVAGAPRRVAERDRLGRDGVRHLQRQPERVRVRHQPARHRVRRPGGARRADAAASRSAAGTRPARSAAASARSTRTGTATGRCKSQITERGWEAEMAIPLKTLRYQTGTNQTWGFNVLRNIRHKNEQVYLAPIPRGFDIYRVSLAAKMTGLDLPARRDIKLIPYVLGSVNKDFTRRHAISVDKNGDVGLDVKWGIRPNLTLDVDRQHRLRAGRGRRRAGQPDALRSVLPGEAAVLPRERVDLPVRQPAADRPVLLAPHRPVGRPALPIDILGGGRLSGKVGGWNVGVLNIQTDDVEDRDRRDCIGAGQQLQRAARAARSRPFELRRASSSTAQGTGEAKRRRRLQPRLRRRREHPGRRPTSAVSAFLARTDSPSVAQRAARQRLLGPRVLQLHQQPVAGVGRLLAGRRELQSRRSASCRAAATAVRSSARSSSRSRRRWPWIRRIAPHVCYNVVLRLRRQLQIQSSNVALSTPFEIQPKQGGRFGWFFDYAAGQPDRAVHGVQSRRPARGRSRPAFYSWDQHALEYLHNPSARVTGTIRVSRRQLSTTATSSRIELTSDYRITREGDRERSAGRGRTSTCRTAAFVTQPGADQGELLVHDAGQPVGAGAVQRPDRRSSRRTSAWRCSIAAAPACSSSTTIAATRPTSTAIETLGRSFVVKYTRLFDF